MRRIVTAACLAFACLSPASGKADKTGVELVYRAILKPQTVQYEAMDVRLTFPGDRDGVTDVDLPNEWGGFSALYKQIDAISVKGATIEKGAAPHKLVLRHKPGARLTISYRVAGTPRPDKLAEGEQVNEYRPVINADYFHLLGETAVPQPQHLSGDAPASFRMEGLPAGAAFASDIEHGRMGRKLVFADLLESVSVGGDFRIIDAGNGARLAIRSKVDNRDDAGWIKAFGNIAKAISGYWQSDAGPYLVTILPFEQPREGHISVGGTARDDAFAFFTTRNAPPETIDLIMAHEMGHSWVPRRIGNMKDGPDEATQYWLSEGFTDFTSWRAMVRAGLWSPQQFAEQWNKALAEYDRLSIRAMPNVEAAKAFWTSAEGQRLPYLRGMLFASMVDDQLRGQTKPTTLRNLLLSMQTKAGKLDWAAIAKAGHAIGLLRTTSANAGLPLDELIATHIDKGVPIVFGDGFMAACGSVQNISRARFHRGFDVEKTLANGNLISGVVTDGPAWKAGLRDGMKLVRRSGGEVGNSQVEIAYDVEDNGVAKTLRWMPEGEGQEVLRRLVLDEAKTESCKAYLSN